MAKRRANGEGTIGQRKDGIWVGRVAVVESGRLRRKAFYGRTKADVLTALRQATHQLGQGATLSTRDQTLATFLHSWLIAVAERVRPTTLRSYEQISRLYLVPHLGRVRLSRLTPQLVETWLASPWSAPLRPHEKKAREVTGATKRIVRVVLRVALHDAMRWGLLTVNAAADARPPRRETPPTVRVLAPVEAVAVLDQCESHRLGAFVAVALAVGLREGEALALRWADVDLSTGDVTITRTAYRLPKGKIAYGEPKSATSRRTVRLPAVVLDRLKAHRRTQLESRLLAGATWEDHDLVFTTRRGRPLHARSVLRDVQPLLRKAGVGKMRLHDLRHSCATLLLAQGVDEKAVAELLGHADVRLTRAVYQHVLASQRDQVPNAMEAILSGGR